MIDGDSVDGNTNTAMAVITVAMIVIVRTMIVRSDNALLLPIIVQVARGGRLPQMPRMVSCDAYGDISSSALIPLSACSRFRWPAANPRYGFPI